MIIYSVFLESDLSILCKLLHTTFFKKGSPINEQHIVKGIIMLNNLNIIDIIIFCILLNNEPFLLAEFLTILIISLIKKINIYPKIFII